MARIHNLGEVIGRDRPADAALLIEILDGRDRTIPAGAFHGAADALARGLLRRGLKRGDAVGIYAANRAEYLIAFAGIMRAGMVAVPVNVKLPRDTVAHIVGDASLKLILTDGENAAGGARAQLARIDDAASWRSLLDPGPFTSPEMGDDEVAVILYTSGSTGRPKGVPLTHGGYVWVTEVLVRSGPKLAGKRALIAAPLFHMNGLLQSLLTMVAGGTVVLLGKFTAKAYLEAAARHKCELITSVPTMLALAMRETETLARLDHSHVEMIVTGSAPSTEALFDKVAQAFPNGRVMNGWGTTESSPVAFGPHPDGKPRPTLSIGYPMPEAEWRLDGGDDPNTGVLWVRNKAIMSGYLNLPAETAKRIKNGWYDTGDIMRRDVDGFFYFVGRADDMFVCGGENIFPIEVETLLERHPAVHQAYVMPFEHELKGEVPYAFVVLRAGAAAGEEDLKQFALANGPAYQHPRRVFFLDQLPLAGTNKIDRAALRAWVT